MKALLTDLYQLTMAAGYYLAGKTADRATFELSVRRLPAGRSFVLAAGLEQALDYLEGLRFTTEEVDYLRRLPQLAAAPGEFFSWLEGFRFTGEVWAVEEGTPVFAGEPLMRITAPLVEAQIPETYLLATLTFPTLVATKAARMVEAAQGRPVIEFGTRRAHTAEAGLVGARAAYLGGCEGTSNLEAGRRFGIPVYGTMAHSWTMVFDSEMEAFAQLQKLLGDRAIYLVDTYDTETGTTNAAGLGTPFYGVRVDSGDLLEDSRMIRGILDRAGFPEARIMASGDLNEIRIQDLLSAGAPIDSFGVGTELATSADAPSMGSIYKLVQIEHQGRARPTAKRSLQKVSLPGIKQVFRLPDRDIVGLESESFAGARPLLEPVMRAGRRLVRPPPVVELRRRAAAKLAAYGHSRPVVLSQMLEELSAEVSWSLTTGN